MLMGTLVYGIRYSFSEYLCTLLVAGGVSIFALSKTSAKTINKLASPNAPLGYGLCFLNLAFDGFTNATQDSITASFPLGLLQLILRRALIKFEIYGFLTLSNIGNKNRRRKQKIWMMCYKIISMEIIKD
ncbi:UDP-galactose/UDP-glucose transporter 3-like [Amaranthus tricolor]|uniref:UDP-galactose/UDP-glucose transporter 3-like n=1 Tax=Amaranthus tricolor TaxID=29722 RepID=UPI00258C259A|nr:UDP-galactose/UDP-glucose transporter 3-like [Amaranthus tricolor]XP_057534263.1 UDP-galactose/UDP-glucose transporter 3-like [Amaranthus tricolor]XP_057534264.1 UDP-galactose/UDP-glucose transporter 3-like [Amaranthus tricolor]XP_057534266.1 UDP-galactose/UDP-glucose transporter 3-like [Amaranthus tricolor]